MEGSAAEHIAEPIHHRPVATIPTQGPDHAGERRERIGALDALRAVRHLSRDHCRAERSLSTVVGRLDARIVQKTQQVAPVVVPAEFVLQPVVVRIRHRAVAEMISHLSLQPLGLHTKVRRLSSVICLPEFHRFSEKTLQTLAEAASSPCPGLDDLADRAQHVGQALLLLHPGQSLSIVASPPVRHHHPSIVRRNHLAHLFVAVTSTDLIYRSLIRLEGHQKGGLTPHAPSSVIGVDESTHTHRCPQLVVGFPHSTRGTSQRVLADRSLTHFHPGQRPEHSGNLSYRNAHPIVEHVSRSHHSPPYPMGTGPVLVWGNIGMAASDLPAAGPAPAYLHPVRRHLRTPNRRNVCHVGNSHSLILESASASRTDLHRHRHLYDRLGDFIGRGRLAVAEQPHIRLAPGTLGIAASLALRERSRLPLSATLGLGELPLQLFVGRLQLRNLLLQSLDQHHQLVALSASDASRLAHSRSLKHLPPPTATPIRTSNPLINVGWTATNALRADLASHCLLLDMSFHHQHTPGEMVERIDGDSNALGGFFSTFVVQVLGNAILLVGILVLLYREDWRAGLVLTGFSTIAFAVLAMLRNLSVGRWTVARRASAETYGFVEESVSAREDIRTNAAKHYAVRRFHESIRNWFGKELRAWFMTSIILNTTSLLFGLGTAVSLGVGAFLFLQESVTIGSVYLIFHYTFLLHRPLQTFTQQMDALQRATASIVRIQELFRSERTVLDGPGTAFPSGALSIQFEEVSFTYDQGQRVLRNLSFALGSGRMLGLIGPTGTGKTTLTRLLFRLHDPDRGTIRLGGKDVQEATVADLRERVGLVTQDVRLFHGTVRDNLTFLDRNVPDERLLEIIDDLGLTPWLRRLNDGLDTVLGPDGGGMSAGEAQLLAFTRVFLKDPGLVVLDEAYSRLDRATEQLIERAMDRLASGRTVVVIAHHLVTVARCDEIMVLEDGTIVEHGDRGQLAEDPTSRFHQLLQASSEGVPP